jgi:hypothetical protein
VATLVAGGKTLLSVDDRVNESETSYSNTSSALVTDGVHRVQLSYSYSETGASEEDYRGIESYNFETNVGLGYRSSYVWGDLRAGDVNWDQATVGNATIRFTWKTEYDAETGSYYESDNGEITLNGRLYAREVYDDELGEWYFENAAGEPMSPEDVEQLYVGYWASEWLYEAVYYPIYALQNWVYSVGGGPLVY